MKYRLLGHSGLKVSELALGTMTFGGTEADSPAWAWGCSTQESERIYRTYREAGGNFIDTADMYVDGRAEEILGPLIQSEREQLVLSSKYTDCNPQVAQHVNDAGNHRKNMVQSVEGSLRRLKTNYIDLYYVHAPDFMTPLEETMRALDDLVRQGKILYVALSDFPAWMISRAHAIASFRGWTAPVALQMMYNLVERSPERELLPMAHNLDIAPVAWSPLANGILTGKYRSEDIGGTDQTGASGKSLTDEERRLDQSPLETVTERSLHITQKVEEIAHSLNRKPEQIALNWLRQRSIIPILGARTQEQMISNLDCLSFELSADELAQLDQVSTVALGFPHDFVQQSMPMVTAGFGEKIVNHRQGRSGAPLPWSATR